MTAEAFVPIEQVAAKFCVTVHTIRAWVRQGHIPRNAYIKAGNTYRFSVERITEALSGSTTDLPNIDEDTEQERAPVQLELNFESNEDA